MKDFHFGENLRLIRITKGLSQKMMAYHLEVSQSTYSRFEYGKRVPDQEVVVKMANVLGVRMSKLLPSRVSHQAKAVLASPFGFIIIAVCFCSLGPAAWELTRAICKANGVSVDTTYILQNISTVLVIVVIWYGVWRVKRGGKIQEGIID